jgi:hypothetical protein
MINKTLMTKETSEILFEFITQGNYVKVIAVDTVTNTEIIIVGDRRANKEMLQDAAIKKLGYVIEKKYGNLKQNQMNEDNLY